MHTQLTVILSSSSITPKESWLTSPGHDPCLFTFPWFNWCQFTSILNRQDSLHGTWGVRRGRWTRKMEIVSNNQREIFSKFQNQRFDSLIWYSWSLPYIWLQISKLHRVSLVKPHKTSVSYKTTAFISIGFYFTGSNTEHWTATLIVLKPFTITDIVLYLGYSIVGYF